MGDFIKELNIIDFLGILFPGAALLLFVNYAEKQQIIGSEFTAADTVIILTAGYFIGSLIHELGDCLEKLIWKHPLFDPKVYAARAMNTYMIKNNSTNVTPSFKAIIECCCNISLSTTEIDSLGGFLRTLGLITIIVIALPFSLIITNFQCANWISFWSGLKVVLILSIAVWAMVLVRITDKKKSNRDDITEYFWIQKANSVIQTKLVNKGNYSKRVVFDGFHVMMRNFMLVILILNLRQYLDGSSNLIVLLMDEFVDDKFGQFVFICAIIILIIFRYIHYSYLKYKYSYEDFFELYLKSMNV